MNSAADDEVVEEEGREGGGRLRRDRERLTGGGGGGGLVSYSERFLRKSMAKLYCCVDYRQDIRGRSACVSNEVVLHEVKMEFK